MPKKRSVAAAVVGFVGIAIAVVFSPPVVRWSVARAQADISRALGPLATVSAVDLADQGVHELDFVVPADDQWRRIRRRLGEPDFMVIVTADPDHPSPIPAGTQDALAASLSIDGRALELTNTGKLPYGYPSPHSESAYWFSAAPGERVRLTLSATSSMPPGSRVVVVAYWNPFEAWDWMDSQSIGQGLTELVAPYASGLGLLMVGLAGWAAFRRKRS